MSTTILINDVDFTELYTPAEVAHLFRVDPRTVARWGREGSLASVRTLGGHRRYSAAQVNGMLAGDSAGRR
jgi:excisionase family DNA binding protein